MAANIAAAAFGFLFWMVAARLYRPQEVGLAAGALSAIGLLSMLSLLGLDYAMVRFLSHAADPEGIINSSLTVGICMAVVLSLVFVAGLGLWSPGLLSLPCTA
jgi:O-antigen/teichoic acid export membrane protein